MTSPLNVILSDDELPKIVLPLNDAVLVNVLVPSISKVSICAVPSMYRSRHSLPTAPKSIELSKLGLNVVPISAEINTVSELESPINIELELMSSL